ncbi:MAG: acyltransferase [Planctomycetota bacterium]|nr:acyltransferase [Planctomycetota bacterium]
MSGQSYYAHESSIIDPPATIGEGTKIWHFCHVSAHAVIGRNCSVGQNCFIAGTVKIGDGCKIQNNVSIYDGVELEDYVFCGPSMVFTNVINPRCEVPRRDEFQKTLVRRGATIGANATVLCGTTLGEYCFIGAGAVVRRDVPAYALVTGVLGRITGWMSRAGHRLEFDAAGRAVCPESGKAYRKSGAEDVCLDDSSD